MTTLDQAQEIEYQRLRENASRDDIEYQTRILQALGESYIPLSARRIRSRINDVYRESYEVIHALRYLKEQNLIKKTTNAGGVELWTLRNKS